MAGLKKMLWQRKAVLIGLILVAIVVFAALGAGILAPFTPDEINAEDRLLAPSSTHFMGTDEFGRDLFSRVLYGARNTLTVAFFIVVIAVGMGLIFGLIAGYYSKLDSFIMRIMGGLMAFPGIVLSIDIM